MLVTETGETLIRTTGESKTEETSGVHNATPPAPAAVGDAGTAASVNQTPAEPKGFRRFLIDKKSPV